MYFFGSVPAWFRELGVSKRRTQAVYLSTKAYREVHWFETVLWPGYEDREKRHLDALFSIESLRKAMLVDSGLSK